MRSYFLVMAGLILVFVLALGCVSSRSIVDLRFEVLDNPVEGRVELKLLNRSPGALCLSPSNWPDQDGRLHQASRSVYLIIGERIFPIEEFNAGYCPGGCSVRVEPGETVFASIPYSEFRLPEVFRSSPKLLEFFPYPTPCD